jgi:uncharacterized ion transporter superfamily protein YfcC
MTEPMKKHRWRVPHTLVLLFGMIVVAYGLTRLLPPGRYQTDLAGTEQLLQQVEQAVQDGRLPAAKDDLEGLKKAATAGLAHEHPKVIRESYQRIQNPERLPWTYVFEAIPIGFSRAQDIIFFVFIIGGAFAVFRATGAADALIGLLLGRFGRQPALLVGGGLVVFAVGSSTIGMAEEYLPFVPVLLALAIGLGFDAVTGVAILCLGYATGYGMAAINPFTVIIAQRIAGVEETSGLVFRIVLTVPFLALAFHHVYRYARRVKADPSKSLVADVAPDPALTSPERPAFTQTHGVVIGLIALTIAVLVYGIKNHDWYLKEMSALFAALTVALALVARISPDRTARAFCAGAAELTTTALLIGFARTIEVVLRDGQVVDTIVHGLAGLLGDLGPGPAAVGMLLVQSVCNFFIPSGSGQALVTMPIMAPLAQEVGVSAQTAVLAYQMGDGFTNIMIPTNAVLIGILTMARIPFERWLRFVVPYMLQVMVLCALVLLLAVAIGW